MTAVAALGLSGSAFPRRTAAAVELESSGMASQHRTVVAL